MKAHNYELTDSVAGFEEGDVLDVTARFGDWHQYSLKLEQEPARAASKTIVVTSERSGFSEAEILDETCRIGDWHEHDLQFDPVDLGDGAPGRLTLTMDELDAIAKPVTADP